MSEPGAEQRRLVLAFQVIATVALWPGIWVAWVVGSFLATTAITCDDSEALICTSRGQSIVASVPAWATALGAIVAGFGGWVWPARSRGRWLVAGYALAFVGFSASCVIASAAP